MGFGLGVNTSASGAGYFFIGADTDRGKSVVATESLFVVDSGGNIGVGNRYPKEKQGTILGCGALPFFGLGDVSSEKSIKQLMNNW